MDKYEAVPLICSRLVRCLHSSPLCCALARCPPLLSAVRCRAAADMSTAAVLAWEGNSSLSSQSSNSSLVVDSVDLSIVWLLLGGFVLSCVLLSAVGGVRWRRHKLRDELTFSHTATPTSDDDSPAADSDSRQSSASSQLSSFSRQLHSAHASTVSLLSEQQSSVRSQLDRLCAEAEQLKALLAARLSGDRGFVDAAIALLLSDITAAESYRRRQAKREEEVMRAHHDCLTLLDEAMHALAGHSGGSGGSTTSTTSQLSLSRVKESAESLTRSVLSAQRESDKERARVRHSSASTSSILGGEAVQLLTRHADDEAEAERAIGRLLHTAHAAADNFLFACLEHDMEVNATSTPAGKGANSSGSSSTVYLHRLQLTCRRFHAEVARSVGAWPAAAAAMVECRTARSGDETEALQCLERQKAVADSEASRGLFAGLDQQLVDSITALIRQTAKQQQLSGQQSQQLSGGWRSAAAADLTSATAASPPLSSSLLSALLDSAASGAAADSDPTAGPFHSDGSSSSLLSPSSLSSHSLGVSFSSWRESDALMSGLVFAEAARQVAVCGELDRLAVHSGLSAADESMLRDAAAAVTTLHSTHSTALVRLGERSRAEEQRAVDHRLAALRDKELEVERQRASLQADFDARMASRATAEADTGDDSGGGSARQLQADFDGAMELLQASLQQETIAAQTELHAIHQQHRSRVAAQHSELRRAQQQQMAEAIRQYEQTHGALTSSADEKCHRDLQLEGVDVPNLRAATSQSLTTPSARETALLAFHKANMDDISRRQQTDRRLMEEDVEQRHRDAMQAMRAEWEEDNERQRAMDDEELEQRVRAASDATTAAMLRREHAEQVRQREKRRQDEWNALESGSQQQHKAALDTRRQQMAAEHAAERAAEQSDQRDEMFQVRITACKQQEAALLDHALHDGTRVDGRRLIECAMASRHAAERNRLIAHQEQDNKQHIGRLLEVERAALSDRRQQIQRDMEEGRLTESEAAAALAAVDADGSDSSVSQRVFTSVAQSNSASLAQLNSRQWDEVKAAMLRSFPDESFSGSGWQQHGSLTPDVAALAAHQAQVMQSAVEASREHVASLEQEELAVVQRCRDEQQQRMEQLEEKLAREESAIRAQFGQQLAEAQAEHEAKLGQLADDLQRVSEQQPVDVRAVLEYEAAIEDEKQSHASLMRQATDQFEAEVAIRSEAQRVHMRAANQQQLNDAIRQARSDRQQQEKVALVQQTRAQDDVKEDARRAMQLLQRHGRRHRARTDVGVKLALRAIVERYTAQQPLAQQTGTHINATSTQPQSASSLAPATHTAEPPGQSVASSGQLDRIEALIRQLVPRASASTPQPTQQLLSQPNQPPASNFPRASNPLSSAIAPQSLTTRQRTLVDGVQRVQAAICEALDITALEVRLTNSTPANTATPAATLPLSHLYTLLPSERVLLLHDQRHIPLSQHCIALAFLSAGRHWHFTETTHSPPFQTSLLVALAAAMDTAREHSTATTGQQRAPYGAAQPSGPGAVAAGDVIRGEVEDEEAVDELNEHLCALLTSHDTEPNSAEHAKLRLVLASIARIPVLSSSTSLLSPSLDRVD